MHGKGNESKGSGRCCKGADVGRVVMVLGHNPGVLKDPARVFTRGGRAGVGTGVVAALC